LDFQRLKSDPNHIAKNLAHYLKSFSIRARGILDHFGFSEHIEKLEKANRLYLVVSKFAEIDLHPDKVSNQEMGYIFEELVRKYNEDANETAGDHFTPREVIRLMVNLLFAPDDDILTQKSIVKTIYDPTCGTGGMISTAEEHLKKLNPDAKPEIFGQDYNDESYAVCGSDMLIKGHSIENIVFGDVLGDGQSTDGFPSEKFDYMLANPPFGVKWEAEQDFVTKEHESQGFSGRFGAGLPRINDGSFLFLQHMISKMKPVDQGGTRLGIVFNGSPLFTGDAGSGESEIRRWIIENDWLEAIVGLPDQLFYNTGIFTYIWIVTNRKAPERKGKVQLINAVSFFEKMRKSLGNKRNYITEKQIENITRLYGEFKDGEFSKIFDNTHFGFRKITVERPLKLKFQISQDALSLLQEASAFVNLAVSKKKKGSKAHDEEVEQGKAQQRAFLDILKSLDGQKIWTDRESFINEIHEQARSRGIKLGAPILKAIVGVFGTHDDGATVCCDKNENPEPDTSLRDTESVPLSESIEDYFQREVKPYVPDAWINDSIKDEKDEQIGIVGYEVPFNRHFYKYVPPRPLQEIEADLKGITDSILKMIGGLTQ
ncbi:MAG: DNA methyltransferase, partial [Deltaproteobacteria bacterium CG11_big_fil_rev_8_21_14_0_20_49_13]